MFSGAKVLKYFLIGITILAAWYLIFPYAQRTGSQWVLFPSVTREQWNKITVGALAIVAGGPWLFSTWKKQAVLPSWEGMVLWRHADVPRTKTPKAFWLNLIAFGLIVLWGFLEMASAFVNLPFPTLWPST